MNEIPNILFQSGTSIFTIILEAILAIAVLYAVNLARKYKVENKVKNLVLAAEEVYKQSGAGELKTQWVKEMVEQLNLNISDEEVNVLIKLVCAEMNKAKKELVSQLDETASPDEFHLSDDQVKQLAKLISQNIK